MKKTVFVLLSLCCLTFADQLPRIAVYVSGSEDAVVNEALSDLALDALTGGGFYRSVDKPQDFAAKTMRERGNVQPDDSLITELARAAGAQYLCLVKILPVLGSNQVSARIVGIESDTVMELGVARSPLATVEDLHSVSLQITKRLVAGQNTKQTEKTAAEQIPASTETALKQTVKAGTDEKKTFTDPRDNKEYGVMRAGGFDWFTQDVAYGDKEKYKWNDAREACPEGWRLPDNKEWKELKKTVSPDGLKEFTENSRGNWWSATENGRGFAWFWYFSRKKLRSSVGMDYVGKANLYGVRCVK